MALEPNLIHGTNKRISRAAIEVSFDENFDDIYNRRFKKYCLLLAKEKELLRRMGKVRVRSSTVGPKKNDSSPLAEVTQNNNTEDPLQKRPLLADGRRASSLKDMRHLTPPRATLTSCRRLSTSYEELDPLSFNEKVDEENYPQSLKHSSTISRRKNPAMPHSHSCEGISSNDQEKPVRLKHAESFDNVAVCQMLAQMVNPDSNGLRSYDRDSLKTSSSRDLTDRNVRDVVRESKTLRSSSPSLERRLAQARLKAIKRDETMRRLDDDFTRAREIMNRYKSTESLNGGLSAEEEDDKRRTWSK